MRKVLLLAFACCMVTAVSGQDRLALRDSLDASASRLAFHPDSVDLRLRKAGYNLQLEQWQYAKDEYDYVLKRHPNNIAALYFRAYANEKLKRLHFARLDYEAVLGLIPNHFEARLGLSLLCQKMGRTTEALDMINLLVVQHPDSAIAYAARAGIEVERNLDDLAEEDFTEAINRDSQNTDFILNRAVIRIRLKRKEKALDDLDRLVELGVPRYALSEYFSSCKNLR